VERVSKALLILLAGLMLIPSGCRERERPEKTEPPKPRLTEQRKARLIARIPEHPEWDLTDPDRFLLPPDLPDGFSRVDDWLSAAFELELSASLVYRVNGVSTRFDALAFPRHELCHGFASVLARDGANRSETGTICFFYDESLIVGAGEMLYRIEFNGERGISRAIELAEFLAAEPDAVEAETFIPSCFPQADLAPGTLHLYSTPRVMELLYSGPEIEILEPGPFVDLYAGQYRSQAGDGFVLFLCEYRNPDYAELVFYKALESAGAVENRLSQGDGETPVPYFAAKNNAGGYTMCFQSDRFVGGTLGCEKMYSAVAHLTRMISDL
jgi:hypothetical protein